MRARTVFLICNTLAVIASQLVGAGRLPLPPVVGIFLGFYALFILPGLAAGRLLFPRRAGLPEAMCRTVCAGIGCESLVVCLGFIPGVSYRVISPAAGGLALVLSFIHWMQSRTDAERHDVFPEARGFDGSHGPLKAGSLAVLLALFGLCFFVFYGSGDLGWTTDSLDHVSYIRRSVDSGVTFPRDSFYRDGDGASVDIRKGLWHPVLALWTYQSHVAPDVLWRLLPSFLSLWVLSSFLFFGIELLGSVPYAILAVLFMLLFHAGEGAQWLTKIGFSRNIMQAFFWGNSAFLLKYYRVGDARCLAAVFLLSAAACAFHIVYAMLIGVFLLGVLAYTLLAKDGVKWRGAFWRSVSIVAMAIAVPIAVRGHALGIAVNEIHAHRQGMLVFTRQFAMVDPAEIVSRVGLVFFFTLLIAPFFFIVAPRGRRTLVFVLTIVPVVLVLNPAVAPLLERRIGYLHYRLLDAAPLMQFCALAVGGLVRLVVLGRSRRLITGIAQRAGALVALAIFVYFPLRASAHELATTARHILAGRRAGPSSYESFCATLERRIPAHSVVVSDPLTSYIVSAYTDHFVVVTLDQHCSPTDARAVDRLEAVRDIMSPTVPVAASVPWLRQCGAEYLVLNMNLPPRSDFFGTVSTEALPLTAEKFRSCPRVFRETIEENGFLVFAVAPDSPVDIRGSCDTILARPIACGNPRSRSAPGVDAGCGIVLDTLAIRSGELEPGDTLEGYLCWKAPVRLSFGLPFVLTVRLDTAFPKGRFYRDWYSKQYRRFIEKRRHVSYRCTRNGPLMSGYAFPDEWEPGTTVRQDFSIVLPRSAAPGQYDLRVKIWRMPYVPNRSLSDYLSNEDSLYGVLAGTISVGGRRPESGASPACETMARRDR